MRLGQKVGLQGLSRGAMLGEKAGLGEDHVQVIDSDDPPVPLATWLFVLAALWDVLVLLAAMGACRLRQCLTYWDYPASGLVRQYLQKMAVYQLLMLAVLYALHQSVFTAPPAGEVSGERLCLALGDHRALILALLGGSLVTGLVRYLAVGFGHSEDYSFAGHHFENRHKDHVHEGFTAHTNSTYSRVIPPYLKLSLAVLSAAAVFMYAPLSPEITDPILRQPMCLGRYPHASAETEQPGESSAENEAFDYRRLWPFGLLIGLPVAAIVLIEHVSHVKNHGFFTKVPGYFTILNAPFVMVAMSTTWTMWLCVLAVTLYSLGAGAGEYFSMLTLLYNFLDSSWLLFITVVIGCKGRR